MISMAGGIAADRNGTGSGGSQTGMAQDPPKVTYLHQQDQISSSFPKSSTNWGLNIQT